MDVEHLKQLLARVYDPSTPHAERAEISNQLTALAPAVWQFASQALSSPLDQMTALYILNVVESNAKSLLRWRAAPSKARSDIREVLVALSRQPEDTVVRRKVNQVLVLVGTQECLTTWPNFAEFVCTECQGGRVGLMLAACENFGAEITASSSSSRAGSIQGEVRSYITNVASPLFTQTMAPLLQSNPILLNAASSLVDWIPLNKLDPTFLEALLICCDNPATAGPALQVLAQILERNYTPPQMADFVRLVCSRAVSSLEMANPERILQDSQLCNSVLNFISAFAKRYLNKADAHISIPRFLELFFNFTLALLNNIGDPRHLLQALSVWQIFVEEASEFETQTGTKHPFASTVMSPLLFRLLERFLYCKSDPARVELLSRLEDSRECLDIDNDEGDDAVRQNLSEETDRKSPHDEIIDCDLAFFVRRIVLLCQAAAMMPLSATASVGQVLEQAYTSIQSEGAKMSEANGRRAARDVSSLIQAVHACSVIFAHPEVCQMPAVGHLASWTAEIVRMCTQQQMWSRGPSYAALGSQAIVCCAGCLPWASTRGNVAFINAVSQLAIETLQSPVGCPEVAKKQAIALLQAVSVYSTNWLALIASIQSATSEMNDFLRGETYALFALATREDPAKFADQFKEDVAILALPDSYTPQGLHKLKRSMLALKAVVASTSKQPQTKYKVLVFQVMGPSLVQASIAVISQNGMPMSAVRTALDVLDSLFVHLRRQMGDETCSRVIGECLSKNHLIDNEKTRERVLLLVERMVQESSRAFDNNLSSVLELLVNLMKNPNSLLEVADHVERICFELALSHMSWLDASANRAQFVGDCLVGFLDLAVPPDLVRQVCAHLITLDDKHKALRAANWRNAGLPKKALVRALRLLSSGVREMVADDLTELAARCLFVEKDNQTDLEYAMTQNLPSILEAFPAHASGVEGLRSVLGKDRIALMEAILTFAAEIAAR